MTKPTFKFLFPIAYAAITKEAFTNKSVNRILEKYNDAIQTAQAGIEAGEIIVADAKEVRERFNDFVKQAYDLLVWDRFTRAGKWESLPQDLREVDHIWEARHISSFGKKLAKVKSKDHEFYGVAYLLTEELRELQSVIEYLKTIEVKASVVANRAKAAKLDAQRKANESDPVYQAVLPLKTHAQDKAEELYRARVEKAKAVIAKHGGDLDSIAPYPVPYDRVAKEATDLARSYYLSICIFDPEVEQGNFIVIAPSKIEDEVRKVRQQAGYNFEAYVAKLHVKIGDKVLSAKLQGQFVWQGSTLVVQTATKGEQIWKTDTIINCSKYGILFNQYPTRQAK